MNDTQKPKDPYALDTEMTSEELAYWRKKEPWNYIAPENREEQENED